jgi:hypothetical protein
MKKGASFKGLALAGAALLVVGMAGTAGAIPVNNSPTALNSARLGTVEGVNLIAGGTVTSSLDSIEFGIGVLTDADFHNAAWGLSWSTPVTVTLDTSPNQTVTTKPTTHAEGVSDGGSTMAMLGGTFCGLFGLRRKLQTWSGIF